MPEHAEAEWPMTRSELARRHKVSAGAVTRAFDAARRAGRDCPQPVNPNEPQPRYLPSQFDPWWDQRPPPGRPPATGRGEPGAVSARG